MNNQRIAELEEQYHKIRDELRQARLDATNGRAAELLGEICIEMHLYAAALLNDTKPCGFELVELLESLLERTKERQLNKERWIIQ